MSTLRTNLTCALSGGFRLQIEADFRPGFTVLFGASGSGKTTLLDCIAGLRTPAAGRIALDDEAWFDASGHNLSPARRRIGYLFQDLALFPHLTAEQNIAYGMAHRDPQERARRVREIAEAFRVAACLQRRPHQLSGGERQRVALARSLVTEPRVVLLDEPLSGLDTPIRSLILRDLRAWNERRSVPIIYVTHNREEVFALAERVLVLENGRIVAQGTPDDALGAPAYETVARLTGYENIFDADVIERHAATGTMTCRVAAAGPNLEVPLTRSAGTSVRVGVRAGDILLATSEPRDISARNVLRGRITELRQVDVTVNVRVECGATFEVHISPGARDALRLAPGGDVWLIMKTHSLRVWQPAAKNI